MTENHSTTGTSLSCIDFLHSRIQIANTISFRDFMQTALYHPNGGYYSTEAVRVGKEGDFFTSVSVGSCFGTLLAHRIDALWREMGEPQDFHLIELGANNASLCIDILKELQQLQPGRKIHYHIVEPLEALQNVQKQHLAENQLSVHHHASLDEIKDLTGVFLSNELIDAFPVEVIRFTEEAWQQMHVSSDGVNFSECWKEIENYPELEAFTSTLGTEFPEAYLTEFRPGLAPFMQQVSQSLKQGMMLLIDYGFPRSHYYHSSRVEGTLQTYYNHQKDDNPLIDPGTRDITTHVDFTHFTEIATAAGFNLHDFSPQHRYLTHYGKKWLQSLEQNFSPAVLPLIKQFQTLTHPGMMGKQFHILEMTKDLTMQSPPCTHQPEEVLEILL